VDELLRSIRAARDAEEAAWKDYLGARRGIANPGKWLDSAYWTDLTRRRLFLWRQARKALEELEERIEVADG
jgi:hypothetical protein